MKRTIQHVLTAALLSAGLSQVALAESVDLKKKGNMEMCVDYSTLDAESKQAYFKELDRRGQLSYKDHERISKGECGTSSTMCGMYMALGKPLAEQSRQIRPMTFKVVHVYPDMYYVSQSGMIVDAMERKEGVMPPQLNAEKPAVAAPPVLYGHPK